MCPAYACNIHRDNLYLLDMNLQPVENGILNWNASGSSVSTCANDIEFENMAVSSSASVCLCNSCTISTRGISK